MLDTPPDSGMVSPSFLVLRKFLPKLFGFPQRFRWIAPYVFYIAEVSTSQTVRNSDRLAQIFEPQRRDWAGLGMSWDQHASGLESVAYEGFDVLIVVVVVFVSVLLYVTYMVLFQILFDVIRASTSTKTVWPYRLGSHGSGYQKV